VKRTLGIVAVLVSLAGIAALAQVPAFDKYEKGPGVYATAKQPESCLSCHTKMEPPKLEPAAGEEKHDVVIVGAGLSGLAAGFKLRDKDVVLLEKDARPGGKIKRDVWEGIKYSQGAAYIVEPEDDTKALLEELGVKPVEIAGPANAMIIDGKLYKNPWTSGVDDLPFKPEVKERLKKAFAEISALADEVTVPAYNSPEKLLELDKVPAVDYFRQYGDELVRMMSPYIRNCFAIEMEEVSALGALTYLACEFAPIYSFPGGLAEVTDKLAEKIGEKKIRYGCYVTEVAADDAGVRVIYRDAQGKAHAIRAKAAIVTVAQNAAKYIVKGLSEERVDMMSKVFHGAYAVAALKTSKPVWTAAYDTWLLDSPVTDVIVADWVVRGGKMEADDKPRKAVLNAQMPLGPAGRPELLSTSVEKLKEKFLGILAPQIPGLKENLVETDIYVYGHALHVAFPGFVTEVAPKLAEPVDGKIFFAGVELDLPAFESAVWSGFKAAADVREARLK
jgi:protoporphyrinogen oxidase